MSWGSRPAPDVRRGAVFLALGVEPAANVARAQDLVITRDGTTVTVHAIERVDQAIAVLRQLD